MTYQPIRGLHLPDSHTAQAQGRHQPGRLFNTCTTIPTTIPVMAMAAGIAIASIHISVFHLAASALISALVAR